ncbi:MAG: hypothetical protein QXD42_04045 [Nitrososphaerales archaeon]
MQTKRSIIVILAISLILLIVVATGCYFWAIISSPTPTPSNSTPTPTPPNPKYSIIVQWLKFKHEKTVMNDYILQVELEIPSIGYYNSKRTPCGRYLSEFPPLEFDIPESSLNCSAKLTIMAFWHLDDVIIDINPNHNDGRWTPFGKKASALVIYYTINSEPMEYFADGNDDGYITDGNNDAYIRFLVETKML